MRLRTFLGILLALVVVVVVSFLSNLNFGLLTERFALSATGSVPLYAAVIAAFLLGFLPAVGVLLAQTLKQELAQRRQRKISREAKSREGSFRRAVDYRLDGQWSRAAAELESCLVDRPEDFSALLHYGEALRQDGRPDEALEVHRRASVLYPRSVAILYQLADDYVARSEVEVAEQIRERVLRDFPGLGLKVLRAKRDQCLGEAEWTEAGRLQERIESLLAESGDESQLVEEEPVRVGLDYQKAVQYLEADRSGEAKKLLMSLLERAPEHIPAWILLGEAELLAGRSGAAGATGATGAAEAAVEIWRQGYRSTARPVFLLRIEDHFIEREQPLEAIDNLHQIIAAAENDALPRFFLGRLYYRLEMHDEALRFLDPLSEQFESSPTLRYLLGRIHQRRGEVGKAVECYQACIQEAGIATPSFVCYHCRQVYSEWLDRCEACGRWGGVELDLDTQQAPADELADQLRTVYERSPWTEPPHESTEDPTGESTKEPRH